MNNDDQQVQYNQPPQNPAANQSVAEQRQKGLLGGVRDMAEQQVDQAIDNLAQRIPGGQRYAEQAKNVASGALDTMEQEAERRVNDALDGAQKEAGKRLGNMLGGMFGGNQHNQGN